VSIDEETGVGRSTLQCKVERSLHQPLLDPSRVELEGDPWSTLAALPGFGALIDPYQPLEQPARLGVRRR
jgi:hypothetical protein